MVEKLKIIGALLFSSILVVGILFFINPSYWIKSLLPVKVEVRTANTKITEELISINLQVILKDSKVVKYLSDSIYYGVYLDGSLLVKGSCNIDKNIINGTVDTIMLPVLLSRTVLKSKLSIFENADSTSLKIILLNHVNLPFFGRVNIPIEREFRIPAPQPLEVKLTSVKKIKLGLKEAIYQLELDIYNPNYVEISLLSADVYVDIKGLFKGNISSRKPIKIKAQGQSTIIVKIDLDEFNLINDGLKVVLKPQKDWHYFIVAKALLDQKDSDPIELIINNSGKTKLLGFK